MNDVAFEWSIPYIPGRKQRCFKMLLIAETIVFLFNGLFLVRGLLVVSAALAFTSFLLIQSWKIEYEFEYVNESITISKIIRKEKRREMYQMSVNEIESFVQGKQPAGSRNVRNYTSNRPDVPVFTVTTKNDVIYLEPNEIFLEEMHGRRLWNRNKKS